MLIFLNHFLKFWQNYIYFLIDDFLIKKACTDDLSDLGLNTPSLLSIQKLASGTLVKINGNGYPRSDEFLPCFRMTDTVV